jgi:type 1 fimbriae regulatory protein FimB/type 1 fimbriae regulatory protein FimE
MKRAPSPTAPTIVNQTVRKYLTEREVESLMDFARKHSRHGHRDATMILTAYRHGLRAAEVCGLEWHQVELDQGRMHIRRVKSGTPSVHAANSRASSTPCRVKTIPFPSRAATILEIVLP